MATFVQGVTEALAGNVVSKKVGPKGTVYMRVGKIVGNTLHVIISTSKSLPPSILRGFKNKVTGYTPSTSTRFNITFTEDMWDNYKGRISLSGKKANDHSFLGSDWTY